MNVAVACSTKYRACCEIAVEREKDLEIHMLYKRWQVRKGLLET